jgi:hypothetical protein
VLQPPTLRCTDGHLIPSLPLSAYVSDLSAAFLVYACRLLILHTADKHGAGEILVLKHCTIVLIWPFGGPAPLSPSSHTLLHVCARAQHQQTPKSYPIKLRLLKVPRQKSVNTFAVLAQDLCALHLLYFRVLSRLFPLVAMKRYRKF